MNAAIKKYTNDITKKCNERINDYNIKLEEHEGKTYDPDRDARTKNNRKLKNNKNLLDVILPVMVERWSELEGIGVSEKDKITSKNRIKSCIILMAFLLCESGEKFIGFMKENPQLKIEK